MKKLLAILLLTTLAACVTETDSKDNKKDDSKCKVKAVKDPELGKVYYGPEHRLYSYVSNFDKRYCTEGEASRAGYSNAPKRFPNNTQEYIECLDSEGGSGSCHNYAAGIYQSLKIYDKICGPDNESKQSIADAVRSYAQKDERRLDVDRYSTIAGALMSKYSCGSGKNSSVKKKKK